MCHLDGKSAFVTGAASGIGLGMVEAFLAQGMRVAMADIDADALVEAASQLSTNAVLPVPCDVSSAESVTEAAQTAIAHFGRVHVVCNNAGVSSGGLVEELDAGDWAWTVGVNFLGVVHGCQAFVPHIKAHGEGGHVVNTASIAGLIASAPGWSPYNATKYAVVGFTEVLREEGKLGGFSASVLCPNAVNTDILRADLHRPERFGPQVSKVCYNDISGELAQGLAPRVVGDLVVEAIEADRAHIFTDPRSQDAVQRRFMRIADDFAWAAQARALRDAGAPGVE